jgi:hypothetical protein
MEERARLERNMVCADLSVALLIGLLLNALAGWWWADPVRRARDRRNRRRGRPRQLAR